MGYELQPRNQRRKPTRKPTEPGPRIALTEAIGAVVFVSPQNTFV